MTAPLTAVELTDPTDPASKAYQFQEVMAVLHGDGGHYLAEHGPKKAADDAIAKHYALRAERDALRDWRRRAVDHLHDFVKYAGPCTVCDALIAEAQEPQS